MIPRIFHFIYLYGPETIQFNINHYISIKSNIVINNPIKVYLYTNDPKMLWKSDWYRKLVDDYPHIELVTVDELTCRVEGMKHPVPYMSHQADILKLGKVFQCGGIYSDVDSIALNPLPQEWFDSDEGHFCYEHYTDSPTDLCTGFFLAPCNLDFLRDWVTAWKDYDPDECKPGTPGWVKYACTYGNSLYQSNKDSYKVTVHEPHTFEPFYLTYQDVRNLFFLDRFDMLNNPNIYQVHTWENRHKNILKVLDVDYFKESNATYAQLGRKYLEE